jgi:hypothetical protein
MPTSSFPDRDFIWTLDDARVVIDEWERSGGSLARFARAHGLTPSRLYWWKKRVLDDRRSPVQSRNAVSITLVPAAVRTTPASTGSVTLRLRDGQVVEIADASPAWIAALAVELERTRP